MHVSGQYWPFAIILYKNKFQLITSQRAVMLCGWGVKARMVRVCVTGETV